MPAHDYLCTSILQCVFPRAKSSSFLTRPSRFDHASKWFLTKCRPNVQFIQVEPFLYVCLYADMPKSFISSSQFSVFLVKHLRESHCVQRVRMIPKPSTHCPQLPVMPTILYPLGGIKELLLRVRRNLIKLKVTTYPEPPVAFPNTWDFLPSEVIMAIPSTQNPLRT